MIIADTHRLSILDFQFIISSMKAALYLIPNTLGGENFKDVIPEGNIKIIREIRHFIVESRKCAVRFLVSIDKDFPVEDCVFTELSEHTGAKADLSRLLSPLEKGIPMGIISDAGCPAVGDPGSRAVEIAHRKSLDVVPLSGPNSIIMALMASGLNGQNFAFNGYLPAKTSEREGKIRQLENRIYRENQTQMFIETPYRNGKIIDSLLKSCKPETRLCIAAGLTTQRQFIKTKTIAEWKKENRPELSKVPAIFLLYK